MIYRVKSTKHCFIRDLKPALNENVCGENLFLYWFTTDVVFFLHCCLASYQYLALVFVFLNLVIFCNRHFWGCMLQHAKRQVKYTMRNLIVMFVTAVCFLFPLLSFFFLSLKYWLVLFSIFQFPIMHSVCPQVCCEILLGICTSPKSISQQLLMQNLGGKHSALWGIGK